MLTIMTEQKSTTGITYPLLNPVRKLHLFNIDCSVSHEGFYIAQGMNYGIQISLIISFMCNGLCINSYFNMYNLIQFMVYNMGKFHKMA